MTMDVFQLIGVVLHVLAIIILLYKLLSTKSCAGISARSQILFALVYTTRYLDLDVVHGSFYNYVQIMYIFCSYLMVFLIIFVFRKTYEQKEDVFLTELLIIPCFIMATYFNHELTALEILWTFSIYLEAVAILPQFYMIYKKRQMERHLFYYLVSLGAYRGLFYIFNWIYPYFYEDHFDFVADAAGILFAFFYVMGALAVKFNGIKIIAEEKRILLRRRSNIFFISNNDPLEDGLNLINEEQDVEENKTVNQPKIEKV